MNIGKKVVCIVDQDKWKYIPDSGTPSAGLPIKGEIYTIRNIRTNDDDFESKVGFEFEELGIDDWFDSSGFRPVDETFGSSVAEKLEKHFIIEPEYV